MSFMYVYISVFSVITLMSLGLGLTLEQISKSVKDHWKQLFWAILFNIVVIPVLALKSRSLINIEPELFTGFFLCMAAAGGGTGSLLTYFSKGDVSFSIALLFLLTIMSLFATPLWMIMASPIESSVNPWLSAIPMAKTLGIYIVAPLFLGMIIRRFWSKTAKKFMKPFTRLSMIMLVLLVAGFLILKGSHIGELSSVLLLSIVAAAIALAGGITVAPHAGVMRALGFTSSIRNVTIAILLANTSYPNPKTMLAVLMYGLAMYIVCFPVSFALARTNVKNQTE